MFTVDSVDNNYTIALQISSVHSLKTEPTNLQNKNQDVQNQNFHKFLLKCLFCFSLSWSWQDME